LFDYLNDFSIIYSDDPFEHEIYIRLILQKLYNIGLQTDIKKYEFNIARTKYIDFIISINNILVDPEKVSIV
jgi:hypothetical protein